MKTNKSLCILFSICLAGFVYANPETNDIEVFQQTGKGIAHIAAKASPAVVSIRFQAVKEVNDNDQDQLQQFFKKFFHGNSPFGGDNLLPNPFRPKQKEFTEGLGSGFVVESNGYIVTNYHVVSESNSLTVKFASGNEYKAKVIGTDQPTDLAIIKIDAENLPVLKLGDSDKMEVGEWAIAIGNPFGLSSTVTVGVVSAKGRTGIGIEDYEDFIQTDASINMGNSGGPLLNARGDVIGINTAIVSSTGGSVGIGFAIPSNIAKLVYDQLKTTGHVVRGYLGVVIQPLTPKLAQHFHVSAGKGILVAQVQRDSPAAKAGLKNGDVITKINDKDVKDVGEFRNYVAMQRPGSVVQLIILRNGEEKKMSVEVGKMPTSKQKKQPEQEQPETKIGLVVQNLTDQLANQLGYQGQKGVVVTQVEDGSPADNAGMETGMLITEVNKTPIENTDQFNKLIKESAKQGSILLRVEFKDMSEYIVIDLKQ